MNNYVTPEGRLNTITLIPGGVLQFYEFDFDIKEFKKARTKFHESLNPTDSNVYLKFLGKEMEDDDSPYIDLATGEIYQDIQTNRKFYDSSELISLNYDKALDLFQNQWVPLPIFRTVDEIHYENKRFRQGPSDWCRIQISKNNNDTYHAIIVFDTNIQKGIDVTKAERDKKYAAIIEQDADEEGEFCFVHDLKNISWFLKLDWIDDWLRDIKKIHLNRKITEGEFDHIAKYYILLELLGRINKIPNVRLINTENREPINVDLVLDIGNARSVGMLIERRPGQNLNLSDGSTLEIRDLSDPKLIYKNKFNSYLTFSRTNFGDRGNHTRRAGRTIPGFRWPSVVRVGQEAIKLSSLSSKNLGPTSISSPKRYLWDLGQRPRGEHWQYSPEPNNPQSGEPTVTQGEFVGFVSNEGSPLEIVDTKSYPFKKIFNSVLQHAVTDSRFSRSSMMMFLISEIICHALVQLNSPIKRGERQNPDRPRRLSKIIFTYPPAMSVKEKNIFISWANAAVDILWKTFEWEEFRHNDRDYRKRPELIFNLDEASATQLVFLYNEIQKKFSGNADQFFNIFGKYRGSDKRKSLRIASFDIGGGTTDMVVTTFYNLSENVTNILQPKQEFRESFNFAGDDILKEIIQTIIIPALIKQFCSTNFEYCRAEIKRKFEDKIGLSQAERKLRTQFTQEFLYPIAIHALHLIEKINLINLDFARIEINFDEVFQKYPDDSTLNYLEEIFKKFQNGHSDQQFSLKNKTIIIKSSDIISSIDAQMALYLYPLSEVVNKFNCDFLLLSGRPSCLPNIQAMFFKKPPILPNRIIPLSNYKIESWYPFSTFDGKIGDPKATAVVGALLSAIASQGNLANFSIMESALRPSSTIAFLGPMDINRQIKKDFLFFNGKDFRKTRDDELYFEYKFASPVYIGFRQFNIERWKATPFYFIELNKNSDGAITRFNNKPYIIKFKFTYKESELDNPSEFERDSDLIIEEIKDINGNDVPKSDLNLQFKSLWDLGEDGGHWMDTGLFEL